MARLKALRSIQVPGRYLCQVRSRGLQANVIAMIVATYKPVLTMIIPQHIQKNVLRFFAPVKI